MIQLHELPQGYQYEYIPQIAYTGAEAMQRGAGWVICAGQQEQNFSRLNSPVQDNGSLLCFSVALPLVCDPKQARSLQNDAGLRARNAIGGKTKIRWLNDVVIGEKQVCYIRCAAKNGVFVCSFIFDMQVITELAENGEQTDAENILQSVVSAMAEDAAGYPENTEALLTAYCEHCLMIMKFVDVMYRGVPLYGFCFAIDRQGGLMVMTQETHTVVFVYSGPASLAKKEPEAPDMPPMPHI